MNIIIKLFNLGMNSQKRWLATKGVIVLGTRLRVLMRDESAIFPYVLSYRDILVLNNIFVSYQH